MGNALDRKSATIVDLNKQLDEAINIATRYREFCSLITGSFTDLLDAAAGYRDAITGDDIKVQMEKYKELSCQIDESAQMIEDLPKMEELETAKEEEKDDRACRSFRQRDECDGRTDPRERTEVTNIAHHFRWQ